MARRLVLIFSSAFLIGLSAATASSQQSLPDDFSVDDLQTVEAERDKALRRLERLERTGRRTDRELAEIDADLLAAAADSRRHEEMAIDTEARLETLTFEESQARQTLLRDEEALEDVLATLMTFGARRPPALAVSPEDAGDAVRAAILMGDITPKLAQRAEALAIEIDNIAELQQTIRVQREDLERTEMALLARRQEIEALYKEKRRKRTELAAQAADIKAQTDQLAGEADNIRDLLALLESQAPKRPTLKPRPPQNDVERVASNRSRPPPPRAASPFAGRALPPVTGELVYSYGQPDESKLPHKGQTWQTRADAQVLSPQDARIKYAGEFRSYGRILILDVAGGYLVVLAGLDILYGETGQSVLAGEPVGRMSSGETRAPRLYIEVRRDGNLVDPAGWLGQNA